MDKPFSLILTNDWELLAEGNGDFFTLQKDRLYRILQTVEKYNGRITIMAELGQQLAYRRLAQKSDSAELRSWAERISAGWEECVREVVRRGHDVQLHWHPAWHNATFDGTHWHLDQKVWALVDRDPASAQRTLSEGREYLDSLGQPARADYQCVAFRAGAFCLQPEEATLPLLHAAGLSSDSSVLPGYWDYLYFDYRGVKENRSPYLIGAQTKLLEFPLCTRQFRDLPLFRRLMPEYIWQTWMLGIERDFTYEAWARERDKVLRKLSPVLDPLATLRTLARMSPLRWLSYFYRTSAYILDYDFLSPAAFAAVVEHSVRRGEAHHSVVALGHTNNAHSTENLERVLKKLSDRFGDQMTFSTLQTATQTAITQYNRGPYE